LKLADTLFPLLRKNAGKEDQKPGYDKRRGETEISFFMICAILDRSRTCGKDELRRFDVAF
jgi:hypothetical protein